VHRAVKTKTKAGEQHVETVRKSFSLSDSATYSDGDNSQYIIIISIFAAPLDYKALLK